MPTHSLTVGPAGLTQILARSNQSPPFHRDCCFFLVPTKHLCSSSSFFFSLFQVSTAVDLRNCQYNCWFIDGMSSSWSFVVLYYIFISWSKSYTKQSIDGNRGKVSVVRRSYHPFIIIASVFFCVCVFVCVSLCRGKQKETFCDHKKKSSEYSSKRSIICKRTTLKPWGDRRPRAVVAIGPNQLKTSSSKMFIEEDVQ